MIFETSFIDRADWNQSGADFEADPFKFVSYNTLKSTMTSTMFPKVFTYNLQKFNLKSNWIFNSFV